MRTVALERGKSFEVQTDCGRVLGWIDRETQPDPDTGTMATAFVAKPIEGRVRSAATLRGAEAHMAGAFN